MSKFTTKSAQVAVDPIIESIVNEDKVPWYSKPNLRWLYFMLFPTCMGVELTSGFDSQLINALQIVESWKDYFDDPVGHWKGFISASYSLGALISLPLVPWCNHKFGRRWSIFIGSCIMIAGAIVQGASQHVGMYIVARLMLGFGIPVCIVAGSALIGELAYPKERPVLTSLFNVSYFVGQIMAAGICYGTNRITGNAGWRVPSYLQIVPSLLQVSLCLFLPESPRWLVSKDRIEEANAILVKYHAEGNADSEFVKAEMTQITETIKIEYEASKETWFDLLRSAGMRRRALITAMLGLFTQWSGNTLISYYLGDLLTMIGYTNSQTKQTINLVNACWSLVMAFTVAMLVRTFRRRVMYMTCVCALLCVYIAWTISMERAVTAQENGGTNKAAGWSTLIFIFLYAPCYNIGFNALTYTYMVELWPYALRSRGISFFQVFGRFAGFFTTFVNPIGLNSVSWRYLISYCCWLGFEVVFVYFMFPETSGLSLEELAFIFESKDVADQVTAKVEKTIHHEDAEVQRVGDAPVERKV
ncbi:High-affinity glucose transporter-like protein [Emericellopsis cladophorae]|uniref:High-affinity glucose transporter-like protein n=1 Tax=Emericellopsis cladophorae TaxID=2686198 RepID=A0A9P9Y7Z7_9HYPO|nr:High-affinity glucose transporter-like protein [Emericellopsis cladophorae]KAI6785278.1 High-affinity glucose transporter-like protein [Emericellopsis cladophorae]